MKLPWLIPLFATAALAQPHGGGTASRSIPYVPTCVTTSGSCPADGYICAQGNALYRCTIAGGWGTIPSGTAFAVDPSACSAGQFVYDINTIGTLTCSALDFSYLGGSIATGQIPGVSCESGVDLFLAFPPFYPFSFSQQSENCRKIQFIPIFFNILFREF